MKKVLVRYKIKDGKVAENESLIKNVYKQLHERNIEGFHYSTFKMADGLSFVHIAFSDNEEANTAFSNLPAFKEFQLNIKDRCDEFPVVNPVSLVGAYKFEIAQ